MMLFVALSCGLFAAGDSGPLRTVEVNAGQVATHTPRIAWLSGAAGRYPVISVGDCEIVSRTPMEAHLFRPGSNSAEPDESLAGVYSTVDATSSGFRCGGTLHSKDGKTVVEICDRYDCMATASVRIQRVVTVLETDGTYGSFNTRFACRLAQSPSPRLVDFEFFVPAHWYRDNKHLPANALAADYANTQFLIREDRIPLPLAMYRDPRTGHAAALIVENRNPVTTLQDQGLPRVVDEGMAFGSLGFTRGAALEMAFYYPGSEGERTFVVREGIDRRWALRSHPLRRGAAFSYTLHMLGRSTASFAAAMQTTWRAAYDLYAPPVQRADLKKIAADGVDLFRRYFRRREAAAGAPFLVPLPRGEPRSWELGLGFIGQQPYVGYLLLEQGLRDNGADLRAKGEAILDFWTKHSLSPDGRPRSSYALDADTTNQRLPTADGMPRKPGLAAGQWRADGTTLRSVGDGMNGILAAYDLACRRHLEKPGWRAYLERVGDWLVRVQNADGSWFRRYGEHGAVVDDCRYTTPNVAPFLVGLYRRTGKERYRQAALRAGDYMWKEIHTAFVYVGSVVDNPTGVDRESGLIALSAFLALHDLTGDPKWLDAARQAADYAGTWVYTRHIPQVPGAKEAFFPRTRTTIGLSVIAAGHSGVDTFFSAAAFDYYRLFLYSHDPHYLALSRQAYHNTKQAMDWDGALGYAHPALCSEAGVIAGPGPVRGRNLRVWLPWVTVTQVLPIVRLQQAFGTCDPDDVERALSAAQKQSLHDRYSKAFGLVPSGNHP